MKKQSRPTGIIRTLPSLYSDTKNVGQQRYANAVAALERSEQDAVYIALAQKPTINVLHLYLLIDGEINVRLNIASYEPGFVAECWDTAIRQPRFWAVCTAPVSRPSEPIKRRGFQGFRYTEDLW